MLVKSHWENYIPLRERCPQRVFRFPLGRQRRVFSSLTPWGKGQQSRVYLWCVVSTTGSHASTCPSIIQVVGSTFWTVCTVEGHEHRVTNLCTFQFVGPIILVQQQQTGNLRKGQNSKSIMGSGAGENQSRGINHLHSWCHHVRKICDLIFLIHNRHWSQNCKQHQKITIENT